MDFFYFCGISWSALGLVLLVGGFAGIFTENRESWLVKLVEMSSWGMVVLSIIIIFAYGHEIYMGLNSDSTYIRYQTEYMYWNGTPAHANWALIFATITPTVWLVSYLREYRATPLIVGLTVLLATILSEYL